MENQIDSVWIREAEKDVPRVRGPASSDARGWSRAMDGWRRPGGRRRCAGRQEEEATRAQTHLGFRCFDEPRSAREPVGGSRVGGGSHGNGHLRGLAGAGAPPSRPRRSPAGAPRHREREGKVKAETDGAREGADGRVFFAMSRERGGRYCCTSDL